jgi:fibro-slime domain-containing protein
LQYLDVGWCSLAGSQRGFMSIAKHRLVNVVSALAIAACGSAADEQIGQAAIEGDGDDPGAPDDARDDDSASGEFVETDYGGYMLGPEVADGEPIERPITGDGEVIGDDVSDDRDASTSASGGCTIMVGVVRDFQATNVEGGHPDFEAYLGAAPTTGLVASQLGADGKPVYTGQCEGVPDAELCPFGRQSTSRSAFDSWYRTIAGVNIARALYLEFVEQDGVYTFGSDSFFPLDGEGYGNSDYERTHNYDFTTELHAKFQYNGGEHFTFTGDDDLWVFVNGKLAIDLGGLHPSASANLDLDTHADALGLELGKVYTLALFHAERRVADSNFRVDTTLAFTECGGGTE